MKDAILIRLKTELQEARSEAEKLRVTLKVPRSHLLYLEKHGKLEEFVDAKVLGQDPVAKWLLMDNAKADLT